MFLEKIKDIFETFFLVYAIAIFCMYFWLAIISAKELIQSFRNAKITNYDAIISSPVAPMITVLAPAYNESLTIVENIKALLGLHYPNFEIIVNFFPPSYILKRHFPPMKEPLKICVA